MSCEMEATRTLTTSAFLIDETDRVGRHRIACSHAWCCTEHRPAKIASGNSEVRPRFPWANAGTKLGRSSRNMSPGHPNSAFAMSSANVNSDEENLGIRGDAKRPANEKQAEPWLDWIGPALPC